MENKQTPIPYPKYADGRWDTIYLRDTFPELKDFRDKQIAAMIMVKILRNTGRYREWPQHLNVQFDWSDSRGQYEGPLSEDDQTTLFGRIVFPAKPSGG